MSRQNASAPVPPAYRTGRRAANGQQSASLGLLAGDLPELGSHVRELPGGGQHRSVTGAAGRLVGRSRCRYTPAALPLDLVDPAFAAPSQPGSVASCSASGGSPADGQQTPTVIDSAFAVGIAGSRVRGLDGQHDRATGRLEWSRRSWGHLGWPGFVTIQRRRRWSRLATECWWSRRRLAASLVAAWSRP